LGASVSIALWLATYLVHSTLLIAAVWLAVRLARLDDVQLRSRLWKCALLGGVATSAAAMLIPATSWSVVLRVSTPSTPATSVGGAEPSPRIAARMPKPATQPHAGAAEPHVADAQPRRQPGEPTAASGRAHSAEATHRGDRATVDHRVLGGTTAAELLLVRLGWLWSTVWLAACLLAVVRAALHLVSLRRLQRCSAPVAEVRLHRLLRRVARTMGYHGRLQLRIAPAAAGPMAVGLLRPVVYVPGPEFTRHLDDEQLAAMLAHELAHLRRRDSLWALLGFLVRHAFFFQPLNAVVCRHLRAEAEYLADRDAVVALANPVGLARCLATLGALLAAGPAPAALGVTAVGMATLRSPLGRRIAQILAGGGRDPLPLSQRAAWLAAMLACLSGLAWLAPRATRDATAAGNGQAGVASRSATADAGRKPAPSTRTLDATLGSAAALADEPAAVTRASLVAATIAQSSAQPAKSHAPARTWVDVPEALHGFRGILAGTVVDADAQAGVLIFQATQVQRVWPQNKASHPLSAIGKTLRVQGISGPFLHTLATLRPGDGVQVEAFHYRGDSLQFPGEWLVKVDLRRPNAQSGSAANDESAGDFPGELHGFSGLLLGTVVDKDRESGRLTLTVRQVRRVWPDNTAARPASAVGRTVVVEGIAGHWLDVLSTVKVGDVVELEARHVHGLRLQLIPEGFRKVQAVDRARD
jgi:beta-lactamase regulating signal transducer with metallopeptidase domain